MPRRLLQCVTLVLAATLWSHCGQVPGDGSSGSPAGSSSSSGLITGEPLNGSGQMLVGGSRLKVQYVLGADGSKQLLGFRDTQLNFGCSFYPITGGGVACIPIASVLGSPFYNLFPRSAWALYYLDSACTQPVAGALPGTAMDFIVDIDVSVVLAGTYLVLGVFRAEQVAVASDGGMIAVYTKLTGTCAQTALPASYVLFGRGQEVPLASLAQGQVNVEP